MNSKKEHLVRGTLNSSTALPLLLRAYEAACECKRNVWEFAVDIADLRAHGVAATELRVLVTKGYAEHGIDETRPRATHRNVRPVRHLAFTEFSCFVVSPRGLAIARKNRLSGARTLTICSPAGVPNLPVNGRAVPSWDGERRELWYKGIVVKRFREPAHNQETILTTFEHDGWPRQIHDPLPPRGELDCKKRLHDTIHSLNKNQANALLCFHGDGTGECIFWEPRA